MAKLLSRRLGTFAEEEILTEAQGGFRSGRRKEKKGTYIAFLDVSKPYNTVWGEGLWRKVQQYGIEEKFVHICKGLYKGIEASVVLEGGQSRWFPIETGLHQSCPLIVTAVIQHICNGHDETARRKGFGRDNGWNLVWGFDVCG